MDAGREASLEEIKNRLTHLLTRTTHRWCFSNINVCTNHPDESTDSNPVYLRLCIPNKLPGDVDVVGHRPQSR